MFDLFEVTKKLRSMNKNEKTLLAAPKLNRNKSKEKTKFVRSDSKKTSYIELNNKVLGGLFFQHTMSKEQTKEKDLRESKENKLEIPKA